MILTIYGAEAPAYAQLFDQMYRLRAREFRDRRNWRVDVFHDGREIDRFDALNPLYVMNVAPNGRLLGSLRLLQTTGPHMLSEVFPETIGGQDVIRDPLVVESTRFCVDTEAGGAVSSLGIHIATGELVLGLFEMANQRGLSNIISVYDLLIERVLKKVGCLFDRLAPPVEYDGLKTVAGVFEVSDAAVASIRQHTGIDWEVFDDTASASAAAAS